MKKAILIGCFVVILMLFALGLRGLFSGSSDKNATPTPPAPGAYNIQIIQPVGGEKYHIGDFIKVAWKGDSFPPEYYMSIDLVEGQISGLGHLWTVFPIPASQSAVIPIPLAVVQGASTAQLKPGPYKFRVSVYDKHFCFFQCRPQDLTFNFITQSISGPVQLLEYVPKKK